MKPHKYSFSLGLVIASCLLVACVTAATFVETPGWLPIGGQNTNPVQANFGFASGFAPVSQNFGNAFVPLPVDITEENPITSPGLPPRTDFTSGGFLSFPIMTGNSFVPLPANFGNSQGFPAAPSSGFSSGGFAPFYNPVTPASSSGGSGSFNTPYIGPAVDFQVVTGAFSSCGLTCRTTNAIVKNTGTQTAHNVRIVMEVRNNADKVMSVNGGTSYERPIGNLESGQSVSVPISVSIDCPDLGACYNALPFTLHYSVVSNELTKKMPDILYSE